MGAQRRRDRVDVGRVAGHGGEVTAATLAGRVRRRGPSPRAAASAVDIVRFDETGTTGARSGSAGTTRGAVGGPGGGGHGVRPRRLRRRRARRSVEGAARSRRRVRCCSRLVLAPARGTPPGAEQRAGAARRGQARPSRRARPASTRPPGGVRGPRARLHPRRGGAAGHVRRCRAELDRLAALGVTVIELMPVHQIDPDEGSYWGYMPLAFGAVHQQYAATDEPGASWTTSSPPPTEREHRGVARRRVQPHHRDRRDRAHATTSADSPTATTTPSTATVGTSRRAAAATTSTPRPPRRGPRDRVAGALRRHRDRRVPLRSGAGGGAPPAVRGRARSRWADRRGVRMIAEPWDASATTCSARRGRAAAGLQWNDRFRDDVRGYLRAESDLVPHARAARAGQPGPARRPVAQRELPVVPRRVHAVRRRRVRPQAQRGERPAQPRRGRRQPLLELRLGGRRRRPVGRCSPCGAVSCATRGACWRCRTVCRWWRWATSSAAPSAATTMPTTRTTRSRGSTGSGATTSPTSSASSPNCSPCAPAHGVRPHRLVGRRRHVLRRQGAGRHVARLALVGVVHRRPVRDHQLVVGAGGVLAAGAGSVDRGGRHRRAAAAGHPHRPTAGEGDVVDAGSLVTVEARSVVILER